MSIPDSVTEIADFAFGSCDIKELSHPCLQIRNGIACSEKTVRYCVQERPTIVIPEGMTEIGEAAFAPRNRRRKFRGRMRQEPLPTTSTSTGRGNTGWKLTSILSHKS